MTKSTLAIIGLLLVQGCTEARDDNSIQLALRDGVTYRVGPESELPEVDQIVLTDGRTNVELSTLLGEIDLDVEPFVDITATRRKGDEWTIAIALDKSVSRVARSRSYCVEWTTAWTTNGGAPRIIIYCSQWAATD